MTTAPDFTADELATLERIEAAPVADVTADVREEAVARAICEADEFVDGDRWTWDDASEDAREEYRRFARAAIDALAAPGTDSSGQAVQRVLAEGDPCPATIWPSWADRWVPCSGFIRRGHCSAYGSQHDRAVAGPQRDHGEEGQ